MIGLAENYTTSQSAQLRACGRAPHLLTRDSADADGDARGQLLTLDAEGRVMALSGREEEAEEEGARKISPSSSAADAWGRGPHEARARTLVVWERVGYDRMSAYCRVTFALPCVIYKGVCNSLR